jgi:hypothetical protein
MNLCVVTQLKQPPLWQTPSHQPQQQYNQPQQYSCIRSVLRSARSRIQRRKPSPGLPAAAGARLQAPALLAQAALTLQQLLLLLLFLLVDAVQCLLQ